MLAVVLGTVGTERASRRRIARRSSNRMELPLKDIAPLGCDYQYAEARFSICAAYGGNKKSREVNLAAGAGARCAPWGGSARSA